MANRKAFESTVLKWINELDPTGANGKFYKEMFSKMSDKDIEEYVTAIESGEDFVSLIYNNLKENGISVDNNLKVAEKMGHDFFERLRLTDPATGKEYLTPEKYMVLDLPVRRQAQMLKKKRGVPEDNRHVDELSGQPTGESKGSGISFPELLIMYSQGLDKSILEFMKLRGGDTRAYNAMERMIAETGSSNMEPILNAGTKTKSTETLSAFLKAMHLDNTL